MPFEIVCRSIKKKKPEKNKWLNEPCYFVLPRHEITSRIITLPSQDINEIKNMVALRAEEFVPYSLEEIQISQCILEELPNSESEFS
jgi:Tfp pilus assembly PilM family ATPase